MYNVSRYFLSINLFSAALMLTRFLRLLIDTLRLPTYCLVDCDPYGFDILSTYRFGSMVRHFHHTILIFFNLELRYTYMTPILTTRAKYWKLRGTKMSRFFPFFTWYHPWLVSKFWPSLLLCKQMAYDAKLLRVPEMNWLGAFPSDSDKYGLPNQCLLPLTSEGRKLFRSLVRDLL